MDHSPPPAGLHRFIYLPIGIGLLTIASLIGYGHLAGERLYQVQSPHLSIINDIKSESSAIGLRIEEALDGEQRLDSDRGWNYLERAVAYLKSSSESRGMSSLGLSPEGHADLMLSIDRLASALTAWKEISARTDHPSPGRQSTELPSGLSNAYSTFSMALADIETRFSIKSELKKTRFRSVQAALIGTCIVLAIAVAFAARRNARERSSIISRLTETNRLLREQVSHSQTMEKTMAERERLFHKVFNDSPVSIIIAHLADMRIVDVNEWFVAATGFEREEILARPLHEIVICSDPGDEEKLQQAISEQRQIRNLECQLPVKAGPIRTALLSATLIELNGEAHILSAARDITEFKVAQRTLCQSEQQFRSLFESAPDFILLLDTQGAILLANPAACKRLGFSAQEMAGHLLAEFLSPESRERFVEQLPDLVARGELRAEYDMVARSGAILPVDCSATTVESGSGRAYIVLFQKDITERRHNELELKAVHRFLIAANRHQELNAILNDFLDIIEDATACEAAAVRVEDEALAKPSLAVRGFDVKSCEPGSQPDSRLCMQLLKNRVKGDESGFTANGSFYCNSAAGRFEMVVGDAACPLHPICAQPSYQSFALIPIQGAHGPIGLIHIAYRAKDKVSTETIGLLEAAAMQLGAAIQRVRAEEALKCSHDELEKRVQERTEQLSAINERLKAEVLERSLTEQSLMQHQHQLRKLSLVLIQTEERERHRIATALHDGIGQTLAAAKIKMNSARPGIPPDIWEGQLGDVRGLITLALDETRSLTFELSPPVLYEIGLRSALEWMAERFKRKFGLPIVIHGEGNDRQLSIPHRVFAFQSIRELCFNAVKHAQASQVDVFYSKDRDFLRIDVTDDGTGFDVKARRKAGDGMGFGLFSIREQLRHYGGTLTFDSQQGKGTRVTLRLPLTDPAQGKGDENRDDQGDIGG